MKALLSGLVVAVLVAGTAAQDIPNASFENWTSRAFLGLAPDGWITTNGATQDQPTYGVSMTDEAYDGDSAVQVVTGHLYSTFIVIIDDTAGQVMTGSYQVMSQTEHLGFPYTERPAALRCHYKFFPMEPLGQDTGRILAAFFKYNDGRDTIGIAELKLTDTVDTYTEATIPITWSTQETPDSAHISLESSLTWMSFGYAGLQGSGSHEPIMGTKLIVDALEFTMPVAAGPSPDRMVVTGGWELLQPNAALYDLRGRALAASPGARVPTGAYAQAGSLHLRR